MLITVKDVRKAGYCLKGVKEWCITHGIDYRSFVKNGIDTDELPQDDYYIMQIAKAQTEAESMADSLQNDISEER